MLLYIKNLNEETSPGDIRAYFRDLDIPAGGIHITRESSVFITFSYTDHLTKAYRRKDSKCLGSQIVKLLCSDEEKELELKRIEAYAERGPERETSPSQYPWEGTKKASSDGEDYPWESNFKSDNKSNASLYTDNLDYRRMEEPVSEDDYLYGGAPSHRSSHGADDHREADRHHSRDGGSSSSRSHRDSHSDNSRMVQMNEDLRQVRKNVEKDLRDLRESIQGKMSPEREVIADRHNSKILIAIGNPEAVRKISHSPKRRDSELRETSRQLSSAGHPPAKEERKTERHKYSNHDRERSRDKSRDRSRERERRHSSESRPRHRSRDRHRDSRHRSPDRDGERSSGRDHERQRERSRRSRSRERSRGNSRGRSRDRDSERRHERRRDSDRSSRRDSSADSHRSRKRQNSDRHSHEGSHSRNGNFILVKNLPSWADIAWVHSYFERCQYLAHSTKLICNESGPLYSYIEVENSVDLKLACQLDGSRVERNTISVRKISEDTYLEDLRNVQGIERKSGVLRVISYEEIKSPSIPTSPPVEYIPTPIQPHPPVVNYTPIPPPGMPHPSLAPGLLPTPYMGPVIGPPPPRFNVYRYGPPCVPHPHLPPGPALMYGYPPHPVSASAQFAVNPATSHGPTTPTEKFSTQSSNPLVLAKGTRTNNVLVTPTRAPKRTPAPAPVPVPAPTPAPAVLQGPDNWVAPLPPDPLVNEGKYKMRSPFGVFKEFHFSKLSPVPGDPLPEIPKNTDLETIYFQGLPGMDEKYIFDVVKQLDHELPDLDYIHIKTEPAGSFFNILAAVKMPITPSLPLFASVNGFICPVLHENQSKSCIMCRQPSHTDINAECIALTTDIKVTRNFVVNTKNILHPMYNHWFSYNDRYNTSVLAAFAHPNDHLVPKHANQFTQLFSIYSKLLKIRCKVRNVLRDAQMTQDILVVGTDPILTTGITVPKDLRRIRHPYVPGLNLAGKALMALRRQMDMKEDRRHSDSDSPEVYPEPKKLKVLPPRDSFTVTKPFHEIAKMKSKQADEVPKQEVLKKGKEDLLDSSKESKSSSFFFSLFDEDL